MHTDVVEIEDAIEIEDAPESYPLATVEQEALMRCEAVIAKGLHTYIEVGRALLDIRDQRLYRATHQTYADYCNERWGMSRQRAYQLIDASQVATDLSTIVDTSAMPESHLRAVAKAAPSDRPKVIDRADQLAGDGPRTAKHIEQAAAEIAAPDLPIDYAIVQRRLATHGITLSVKDGMFVTHMAGKSVGIATPTWSNVTDRLERFEDQAEHESDHPEQVSDRQAHLAQEARDAGHIERARSLIAAHNYATARTELDQVSEASAWTRDQLLATILVGRQITLGLSDEDCQALLREAHAFEQIGLTKKLPAIGQALVLIVQAIKGAA